MGAEAAGLAGAGIGAIGGIAKTIIGAKQAREAQEAIDSYQRQDLNNVFEGLSVSTLGADLQREELARASATSVGALQTAGARALVGGIGTVQQQNVTQSRQIGADLDVQQKEIDKLRAQDNARIQQLMEQRENADLAGLGQQLAVGQQNIFGGIGDATQAGTSFANLAGF